MSDLEIAKKVTLEHIKNIAKKVNLKEDDIEMYGSFKAKLPLEKIDLEKAKKVTLF